MLRVTFTANLRRHVDAGAADVPGATVGEALARPCSRGVPSFAGTSSTTKGRSGGTWWCSWAEKRCAIACT